MTTDTVTLPSSTTQRTPATRDEAGRRSRTVASGRRATALSGGIAMSFAALIGAAGPAEAAPTGSAVLTCGSDTYTVTGFGRGQVLFVEGSGEQFVVASAELADGTVVFDAPGRSVQDDVVECTTTPPGSSRQYTFLGFFTPAHELR